VGHSLLVIFSHMLKSDVEYQDLGVEDFDHLDPERPRRYLVKRLERLGYEIAPAPGFDAEPACGLIAAPEEAFKANAWLMAARLTCSSLKVSW
jgi:hypothetical protein